MKTRMQIVVASSLLALGMTGRSASAHSFPETETPSAGQTLPASPNAVSIKFDAPIEHLFAQLQVLGPDGKDQASGAPEVDPDGYTLRVPVASLKAGAYTVKWAVVCIDTHHTFGSYEFSVGQGGS